MDHNTKKQIEALEIRNQELKRKLEELDAANAGIKARNEMLTTEAKNLVQENKQLKAELEERKAAWEMKNERLRAKIKELEEQKADQEAQLNYQKSLAQKLEGFQPVRICNEETKFKVLINTEVEDGLFTEPVGFTFSDYKSMDDFIQMALLHGQNNISFTIKKGED
jgi:DNA repair exonuclease SbcCD ATPase subunit